MHNIMTAVVESISKARCRLRGMAVPHSIEDYPLIANGYAQWNEALARFYAAAGLYPCSGIHNALAAYFRALAHGHGRTGKIIALRPVKPRYRVAAPSRHIKTGDVA